jgi:hypothetical protein
MRTLYTEQHKLHATDEVTLKGHPLSLAARLWSPLDATRGLTSRFEPAICLQGLTRMNSVSHHQSSGDNYVPTLGRQNYGF